MTPESVIEIGQSAVTTAIMVAGPMLLAGMVVGLIIAIVQAATQINEMTMTFVPKILAVFVALIVSLPWIMSKLTAFTVDIFDRVGRL